MQSLRQQQGERMDTIMLQAWHTVLKHLFSFCGLCSLTKSPIKVIEKVWIHSRNWEFSNVQVNAAISHFVDVTIKHVGEAVNSGSAYMWNPIFVAPSSGADQWLHLLLCGCPSWTDGSALPSCESNKVTPLKAQDRQGSKISNKGCSCSIRAQTLNITDCLKMGVQRQFPFAVTHSTFDEIFMKNACTRQQQ